MAKNVQHISFTNKGKKDVLNELDYKPYHYSGKLNDAPKNWRHLYRDLKQGYYVVTEDTEKPIRMIHVPEEITRDEEKARYVLDQTFLTAVSREIAYVEKGVFVEVLDDRTAEVFEMRDIKDFKPPFNYYDDVAAYMAKNARVGWYFYRDSGEFVGPYRDFTIMLYDAIMDGGHTNISQFGVITNASDKKSEKTPKMDSGSRRQAIEHLHSNGNGRMTFQQMGDFSIVLRGKKVVGIFTEASLAQDFVGLYV